MDMRWLLWINQHHAEWADSLMWGISGRLTWLPLYVLLIVLLFWRFGWKRALVFVVAIVAAVGLSDWISSGIIKNAVCRLRPTHEPALGGQIHVVHDYLGGMYGFVSSHAANTISLSLLFCLIWTKTPSSEEVTSSRHVHQCWWLMLWVVLNCYSRMYLGVHYPGDILGGLLVGSATALGIWGILLWIYKKRNSKHKS